MSEFLDQGWSSDEEGPTHLARASSAFSKMLRARSSWISSSVARVSSGVAGASEMGGVTP